jgi:hydrogenase maturation protein HypF
MPDHHPPTREPDRQGERRAVELRITGTVQGVGFRPFLARTAAEHGLAGVARNTDHGVTVSFEGPADAVTAAVDRVRTDPPPLASVERVTVSHVEPAGREGFDIVASSAGGDRAALPPPDTAICEACRADLQDPDSRFHGYWATACVDCGPRFSVIEGLPYDRERTALAPFPLCPDCRSSYGEPTDRRFHAQTVACPDCGPGLTLLGADGTELAAGTAALDRVARRLAGGETVALKGAGGAHLACRATDAGAVRRLRERAGRPAKPFAVMAPDLERVRSFATVSPAERDSLTGRRRPIVLLDAKQGVDWLTAVAPGLHTVGTMLPYSGLHHLLFDRLDDPLVTTSANRPGAPMATGRDELLALRAVDAALVHDRAVVNRCDDSVVRHVAGGRRPLRRSRGWVPEPLDWPVTGGVLAVGGRSDVTVTAADGDRALPGQHVGSVTDPATARFHRESADHLLALLDADPEVVAHDLHPGFRTTELAGEYAADRGAAVVGVWHHHAHAAGLLAEHGRDRAVVVAADGTGLGPDGVIRGGELLDSRLAASERVGGLSEFRLPGGERAVERPARTLASLLDDNAVLERRLDGPVEVVRQQADSGVNSPVTTSAGRFLDAASALLGVCTERRYRGEPALRLEAVAARGDPLAVDPPVDRDDLLFRADRAMARLATLADEAPTADVAATAQALLADGLAELAVAAARERGVGAVGLTGGVAYNASVAGRLRERVERAGLEFLAHTAVPPGDGGLSYGQAVAAGARLE